MRCVTQIKIMYGCVCVCYWLHYSCIIPSTITTTTTTKSCYPTSPLCRLPVSFHLKKSFVPTGDQAQLGKSHFLLRGRHKEDREALWEPVHNKMLLASRVSLRSWSVILKLYRCSVFEGSCQASTQTGSGAAKQLLEGCHFWFI